MQTRSNQAQRKTLTATNVARIAEKQKYAQHTLPSTMQSDLVDAFHFYDKQGDGIISMSQFRNILHNFGFGKMSKKEIDQDLTKADPEFLKRQYVELETVRDIVAYRWQKTGEAEEAKECFRIFDKRDRQYFTAGDVKQVFSNYLEFPMGESDIQDFVNECGGQADGNIHFQSFKNLFKS